MTKLTKAQRKAIRNAGPYRFRALELVGIHPDGMAVRLCNEDRIDILTALNAIASEPEAVAAARDALLRAARLYDDVSILKAAQRLRVAMRAAKRAARGSR